MGMGTLKRIKMGGAGGEKLAHMLSGEFVWRYNVMLAPSSIFLAGAFVGEALNPKP